MDRRKIRNWSLIVVAGLLLFYVYQVVSFEMRLGRNQPENPSTIVIATFNADNERHERVLRLVEIDGHAYVAAQHWPRAWYRQALARPEIEVKMDDVFAPYRAVPVEGAEDERVRGIYTVTWRFRYQTGFPPRRFLRLDPL
jgi:hypothetical protein